ncbi:hypothetical protein B0T21DRAFT_87847 [Apiosordaria backusii]|uniref:Uncharacterized protein n=1 Tax=Apiosordaria backusii TaxID=314023 RepID=A0AA40ERW0_9PEZI|nr:hypothetical protein B0T21DRAFT_87847 [Apiosordaria backusii]
MVRFDPDLASSTRPSKTPCNMEELGEPGRPSQQEGSESVQKPGTTDNGPVRPVPQNFVWRLYGGRSSSDSTSVKDSSGDMALGVPVLRETFDPWRCHDGHDEDDGGCKGCIKINKARAAAAALATPLALPSHAVTPGELMSALFNRFNRCPKCHSPANPHIPLHLPYQPAGHTLDRPTVGCIRPMLFGAFGPVMESGMPGSAALQGCGGVSPAVPIVPWNVGQAILVKLSTVREGSRLWLARGCPRSPAMTVFSPEMSSEQLSISK